MSFSRYWFHQRGKQAAQEPALLATAERHRAVLQEYVVDLAPGRDVVLLVTQLSCSWCWGQRRILEPGPLGLCPVVCERCHGTGREPV